MSNVVQFGPRKKPTPSKGSNKETVMSNSEFEKEVTLDINKLCDNLGLANESEAIAIAGDFYRKYPALMEHVRSQKYLLGEK